MVAVLRASWFAWRLPAKSIWSDDLFAQAKLLHRLGFHTAAVMTARAALDRLIRHAITPGNKSARNLAGRCPTGQCYARMVHMGLLTSEQAGPVKKAVGKLNKFCHGRECDAAVAAELLELTASAHQILVSAVEVTL